MGGSDEVIVPIPRDLVAPYPSVELNPLAQSWCTKYFENEFSVVRLREDLCHNGISYWVHGAALVGSTVDMVLFKMKFLPDSAAGILRRIQDDPYRDDPDWGSW
jgi:hypothetical protein